MTPFRLFFVLACLASALCAAAPEPTTPAPAATSITVATPVSELAAGYAAAIQQMSLKSLVIYFESDGQTVALKGVRSAKALHGVVLITFSAGDMMAINAGKVILISDGNRTPQG